MFKPELWQSHDEYRTMLNRIGCRLSHNNPKYFFDSYEKERQMLLNLNLDPLLEYIPAFYSNGGRLAEHQAQILRSLILFTLFLNRTSLTLWVTEVLPNSISLAVLIGCPSLDGLPPLGSYSDFMNRFWMEPRDVYSRSSLLPAGKNGKLVEQEDPSTITTKDIVDAIKDGQPASDNPEAALQRILFLIAVIPSIRLGLIGPAGLTLSGDGTALASHASPYGRHLASYSPSCPYRDNCGRHYSAPDARWGWDSDNKAWYFGHTLYMLCCRDNELKVELPILLKLTDAKRHDSKRVSSISAGGAIHMSRRPATT